VGPYENSFMATIASLVMLIVLALYGILIWFDVDDYSSSWSWLVYTGAGLGVLTFVLMMVV